MKPTQHGRTALFTASLSLALLGLQADTPRGGHPPSTRAGDVKESFGNIEIADPYRWLEEQTAPETRAWIDEQNKYSEAFLRAFPGDRKSTRLNSSHVAISYAVFCLKKKKE